MGSGEIIMTMTITMIMTPAAVRTDMNKGPPLPCRPPPSSPSPRHKCRDVAADDTPRTWEYGRREDADDAGEDITMCGGEVGAPRRSVMMMLTDDGGGRPRRCCSGDDVDAADGRRDDAVLVMRGPCRDPHPGDPTDGRRARRTRPGATLVRGGNSSSARKSELAQSENTGKERYRVCGNITHCVVDDQRVIPEQNSQSVHSHIRNNHTDRLDNVVSARDYIDLNTHRTIGVGDSPLNLSVWRVAPAGFPAMTAGPPGVVPGGDVRAGLSGGVGPNWCEGNQWPVACSGVKSQGLGRVDCAENDGHVDGASAGAEGPSRGADEAWSQCAEGEDEVTSTSMTPRSVRDGGQGREDKLEAEGRSPTVGSEQNDPPLAHQPRNDDWGSCGRGRSGSDPEPCSRAAAAVRRRRQCGAAGRGRRAPTAAGNLARGARSISC